MKAQIGSRQLTYLVAAVIALAFYYGLEGLGVKQLVAAIMGVIAGMLG